MLHQSIFFSLRTVFPLRQHCPQGSISIRAVFSSGGVSPSGQCYVQSSFLFRTASPSGHCSLQDSVAAPEQFSPQDGVLLGTTSPSGQYPPQTALISQSSFLLRTASPSEQCPAQTALLPQNSFLLRTVFPSGQVTPQDSVPLRTPLLPQSKFSPQDSTTLRTVFPLGQHSPQDSTPLGSGSPLRTVFPAGQQCSPRAVFPQRTGPSSQERAPKGSLTLTVVFPSEQHSAQDSLPHRGPSFRTEFSQEQHRRRAGFSGFPAGHRSDGDSFSLRPASNGTVSGNTGVPWVEPPPQHSVSLRTA